MKSFLYSHIFLCPFCIGAYSQNLNGSTLLVGSFSIMYDKDYDSSDFKPETDMELTRVSLSQKIGYFISASTLICVGLYTYYYYFDDKKGYRIIDINGTPFIIPEDDNKMYSLAFAPFLRHYFELYDKFLFYIHDELSIAYFYSRYSNKEPEKYASIRILGSIGIAYYLTSSLLLEAQFGGLQYKYINSLTNTFEGHCINLNLSMSSLYFGLYCVI